MESMRWIPARQGGRNGSSTVLVCPYCVEEAGSDPVCPRCGRGSEGGLVDFRSVLSRATHARLPRRRCGRCGSLAIEGAAICPHCRGKNGTVWPRPSIYHELRERHGTISLPRVLSVLEADLHATRRATPSLALRTLLEIIAARTDIHPGDLDPDAGVLGLDRPSGAATHSWQSGPETAGAEVNGLMLIEIVLDAEIVFESRLGGVAWPVNPTPRQLLDLLVRHGPWNPPGLSESCPSCGLGYRAPIARAGDRASCRRCQAQIEIPWPSPSVWGEAPDHEPDGRIDVARTETDRTRRPARSSI